MSHRWVDTQSAFDELIDELAAQTALAVDTEFHRERTYYPKVAVVQVAWRGGIALVDALAVELAPLRRLLAAPLFVMHAAGQDLEVFQHACGALPARLFDTQLAAGFAGHHSPSLAALVASELGVRLPKADRLADWLHRPVSAALQSYAAADVAHLLDLHDRLRERLTASGRIGWAEDECAELLRRGGERRDPAEAWWRIREARSFRGEAIGVAQSLAAWRETRAQQVDQPARFVLPDLALVAIAQRPPGDLEELGRVRGLDGRHLRHGAAAAILDAVARGRAMPPSEYRLPPAGAVDRDARPAVALASAWVSQLGRELGIDPTLLATRADVEALLRGDEGARLDTGWRRQVVGDAVRRLAAGEVALAFDGTGGLVLEERSRRPISG